MSHNHRNNTGFPRGGVHADVYRGAEEALQEAIALVNNIVRRLTTGNLTLTADEAARLEAHLQELVLQAAAVRGRIRDTQQYAGRS